MAVGSLMLGVGWSLSIMHGIVECPSIGFVGEGVFLYLLLAMCGASL